MTKKVLIIEDRRETLVFIANNILKPEGWEIITARDGELGLQKALEEKPNLIITDLKLPKMHGLDMLEELRKRGFHIPTIVMTFHGSEETAIRAFRLGAADYLIKPFDIEEMLAAILHRKSIGGWQYRLGIGTGQRHGTSVLRRDITHTITQGDRQRQRCSRHGLRRCAADLQHRCRSGLPGYHVRRL